MNKSVADFIKSADNLKQMKVYNLNILDQFICSSIWTYRDLTIINKTTLSDIKNRVLKIKINNEELSINL